VKETGEVIRENGATDDTLDLNGAANRILQYATFGTERVYLSNDDVAAIKRSSQPETGKACLILLGFKPISSIPIHLILDKAYFIYPTEEGAEGSTEAFAYLHASMRSKNVAGIGELLTHTTSTSRMVAIFPQDERKEVSENGFEEQILPPGMIIVKLPFEDDLRALEEDENVPAGDELIEKAMDLIQHQMLDDVEIGVNFENKSLHKFWSYIESVALDFPVPAEETYEMDLNEIEIWKAAGPQIESFRDLLPLEESIKSEVKLSSAVPQKRKKPEVPEDKSGIDWMHLFQTNCLPSSKVEDLKSFLKSRGSRCGGRKADLISRVSQIISEQINQENSSKIYNS
jgi:ATP-dependent DNA helicase 2 subunit 1